MRLYKCLELPNLDFCKTGEIQSDRNGAQHDVRCLNDIEMPALCLRIERHNIKPPNAFGTEKYICINDVGKKQFFYTPFRENDAIHDSIKTFTL